MVKRKDSASLPVLGAIDVGTNAVRLELARLLPDGSLETLHAERDPVRPGEGVFETGNLSREVADRLLSALRRYGALCRRYQARVRAVATSAVREARNGAEIVRRARVEAGIDLEIVSGREEARLICLGVLAGKPEGARSLVIDIGGGSTEVAFALGQTPKHLWSVAIGAVRLAETFKVNGEVTEKKLRLMREYTREAFFEALPWRLPRLPTGALGSSGTINALVGFAGEEGKAFATAGQITRAVDDLAAMDLAERCRYFDARRAENIVPGAVALEAVVRQLKLATVTAVERGLRNGLLLDLVRRARRPDDSDSSLFEAALAMGRRFRFDEAHGQKVAKTALALFDDLASLHLLPASARPLLETAALLHDVGNAVSYEKHHKHTYYLIKNADIPGLADRERELVALVARYHRRSPPEHDHHAVESLSPSQFHLVRKLATLLRLADSLDRSHHQPLRKLRARVERGNVVLKLQGRGPLDLELWDASREEGLFRRVFGKRLVFASVRR
jgi:exopolyphosphatase/guanosine-5'-triphosphate,3'-diphosphate pyrophosphatase